MSTVSTLGIIVFLFHLGGILAAIDAIWRSRTPQGAIAWAVLLVVFPYFALIPYFIFGSNRFESFVKARRDERNEVNTRIGDVPWRRSVAEQGDQGLPAAAKLTQMPMLEGNDVRLLVNGEATFEAIFDAIDHAKSQIVVEFFTIAEDELGQEMLDKLLARAADGVDVMLLCDGIGSHGLKRSTLERLRQGGIKAHKFVTSSGIGYNRFQVNFRNHRKLVIVDSERAFVGGHNVSNLYISKEPPLAPWRDTHIELRGPIINCLQYSFAEDWYWTTKQLPELGMAATEPVGDKKCQALPTGPADGNDTCVMELLELIGKATKRVWISTPYLVPDDAVFAALQLAVNRGVDVRILVPGQADHITVYLASCLFMRRAFQSGMRIYNYRQGFVHQKVWLVDDEYAVVGSANLDNRSLRLNFELMVATFDAAFASEIEQMLLHDFSESRELDQQALDQVPIWRQIGGRLANLVAPIL
ncbi:cardiolipin synthase [Carnimonas bestiolae]|uniref:cardiolipin synthase n=1 Tax=Carnimonas bestiolae TaxID=3402172 RepID=UPI003EDBBD08